MRKWILGCVAVLLPVLLAGCSQGEKVRAGGAPLPTKGKRLDAARSEAKAAAPSGPGAPAAPAAAEAPATVPAAVKNRKIVYTAQLSLEVKAVEPAVSEAQKLVAQCGGYLSNLEQEGGAQSHLVRLTARIPAARFDAALAGLAKLGRCLNKQISTDDVSEQWTDLDARLRNLKREEERLLAILKQASRVADLLTVERELARVRGSIEQLEGQLRGLNDKVALSTITATFALPPEVGASAESGSWLHQVASDAAMTFVGVGRWLVALLLQLLALAPYAALLGLPLAALRRRRRGRIDRLN